MQVDFYLIVIVFIAIILFVKVFSIFKQYIINPCITIEMEMGMDARSVMRYNYKFFWHLNLTIRGSANRLTR